MKLNQYKVGLSLVVIISILLFSVSGFALVESGDTWLIENQADFGKLVGEKLSAVDFNGDDKPDIKAGDMIELAANPDGYTQTASITIDLQNITFRGASSQVTVEQKTAMANTYGNYDTVHVGYDGTNPVEEDVTSSLVIKKEGVHVKNLVFEAASFTDAMGDVTATDVSNNAILVDIADPCICEARDMMFENISMPACGQCCDFDYGIRFVGTVEPWGGRESNYSDVDFLDVKIKGVSQNGIEFANSVGDVKDMLFDELYIGNSGPCGGCEAESDGFGLFFNNYGSMVNVRVENSNGLTSGPLEDSEYGIENNSTGIRVNGYTVSKVEGLRVENVDIMDNCDNGIHIGRNSRVGGDSAIGSIDMTVKDSKIAGNGERYVPEEYHGFLDGGFGILVGDAYSDPDWEIISSPAKLDKVVLDNVKVYNNLSGGAGFFASKVVNGSKPGFVVKDSRFNEEITGDNHNRQGFGLTVSGYEGIKGVSIENSTFHDHDGGLDDVYLTNLPNKDLNDGIALLAAYENGEYDEVENVTIENTSAKNNVEDLGYEDTDKDDGSGLLVEGDTVIGVEVTKVGKFNDNGSVGIGIYGQDGVEDVTINDNDGDDQREITANGNGMAGLAITSDTGDIKGIHVANAQFGVEGNNNTGPGVLLETTDSDSSIGSSDSDGAIKIDNISASYNLGSGMIIDSAEDFLNPSNNVVVKGSEFLHNHVDGMSLFTARDVMNPRFSENHFIANDVNENGTGLLIEFGNDLQGTAGTPEINGNSFAGNVVGMEVTSTEKTPSGSLDNFLVEDNITFYVGNEKEYSGNEDTNMALVSGKLNSVHVKKNVMLGEQTEVSLLLEAEESSSAIEVKDNIFRTRAEGACIGLGTAIVLDAWNTDINHNEFEGFSMAIKVLKEKVISASSSAGDTSNHINKNNIEGCCKSVDASKLEDMSDDTGNLYMVDATENYWGPDATPEDVRVNLVAPDYVFYTDILDDPVVVIEILEISDFKSLTADPQVNDTVELEYTLKNVSDSKIGGQSVHLIVKDPDDRIIVGTDKEDVPELNPGKTYKNTHSFVATQEGTYTATLEVDQGAVDDTISIEVSGGGPTPPPTDDVEPDWGVENGGSNSGILPAPVTDTSQAYLRLGNKDDQYIGASDVEEFTVRVFDLSGKKLYDKTVDSPTSVSTEGLGLPDFPSLMNGLYLYTVEVTTDDDYTSPVMKFLVKK